MTKALSFPVPGIIEFRSSLAMDAELSSQEKKRLEDLRVIEQRGKLSRKEQDELIDLLNKRRA